MLGSALVMIFGLAALLSALGGVVVLIVDRRISRIALGTGAVSAAVLIGCMMTMPPGYSPGERERVERLHAQFAPALERYRQAHGEYPPTLEAAGIPTPTTLYGPLRYDVRREKDGTSVYTISFGDYGVNGFTTWWDSRTGGWWLDS